MEQQQEQQRRATQAKGLRAFLTTVTAVGLLLWLAAAFFVWRDYTLRDQLIFLGLVPLVVSASLFPNIFPIPSGLKLTQEKVIFTPSDSIVLLVACWYGTAPAIFIAGLEGFVSSRRAVRRLTSNVFSFGMMGVVTAASSTVLGAVLRYGFHDADRAATHSFPAAAVALLAANLVHIVSNTGLVSTFFALRKGEGVIGQWKKNFMWAVPNFLPTSAVASVLYITLQYNALITCVIGAPILVGLYLGHRQYRNSVQARLSTIERAQRERIQTMEKAHRETIEALAVAINAKDEVTHEHVMRVQVYAAGVARILGCSDAEIDALRAGALLHDIGKIAVPDYILNKPGKLTAEEFERMKVHTLVGAQILGRVDFPYPVVPVVRHHHERWDGRGYPDGLRGEEIPLTARVLSVVDCFDAVREDRQYRKGLSRDEAIRLLMDGVGAQYDPRVVGTFVTHLPEFEAQILAMRSAPVQTYGIEPAEQLSEAARAVAPAAGLAEALASRRAGDPLTQDQSEALSALARALSESRDLETTSRAFAEHLKPLVPFDTCVVTLAPPHAEDAFAAHAHGRHAELFAGRRVVAGEGVTGWALANRQPFYNADPKLDLTPAQAARCAGLRTLAACPVADGEEVHGVVTVYSSALDEYHAEHRRLFEEATRLLAAALGARDHADDDTTNDDTTDDKPLHAASAPAEVVLKSELMH